MEGDGINPLIKTFVDLMDNRSQNWASIVYEDVVLDWFGRCYIGIKQVRSFVRDRLDQTSHVIDSINSCPPVRHRCLKQKKKKELVKPVEKNVKVVKETTLVECGQGDGWGVNVTPPHKSIPFDASIVNAPKVLTLNDFKLDEDEPLRFLKIKGTVKLHKKSLEKDKSVEYEKNLKHIIIAYSDNMIKLIVYEGTKSCRRSLNTDFIIG